MVLNYSILYFDLIIAENHTDFQLKSTLKANDDDPILAMDFSELSLTGVSAGGGGKVTIWKLNNQTLSRHLCIDSPSSGFSSIGLRSDSKLIIACGWDGIARIYGPKKGTLLALLDFHRENITSHSFSGDLKFVTASRGKDLCLWSLYSNK